MPTGVALRDARQQLFDAAERILLRDGPGALTSRAVTTEAGCAKGVLHRHFAGFEEFLAEFVLDRMGRMDSQAAALRGSAGTGTVAGNLTEALTALYGSVAVAIVGLVATRESLRARLSRDWPAGIPVVTEAMTMVAGYLESERDLGRIASGADIGMLAPTVVGAVHMQYTRAEGTPPDAATVGRIVTTAITGSLPGPGRQA
ncbi:MAG TPA: TetR family transcriptional regulator [Streptosporangiaceae bacterium]